MMIPVLMKAPLLARVSMAIALTVVLAPSDVAADEADPASLVFEQGSILVICGRPVTGGEISSDEFFAGYSQWLVLLQEKAKAGIIARAHYLTNLKDGIFIVFDGPDRGKAREHANATIEEMTQIYSNIEGTPDVEICESHEIGPEAA